MPGVARARIGARIRNALLAAGLSAAAAATAAAQPPAPGREPYIPVNRRVESIDLAPVQLPTNLWHGMDAEAVGKWLSSQDKPPRSPALAELWRRLILSGSAPPAGPEKGGPDAAGGLRRLRLEALYRAGMLIEIREVLARSGGKGPAAKLWQARVDIGLGVREKGCQALGGPVAPDLAKRLRAEKQLLIGYCAAVGGDARAAALAASLAREEGSKAELALAVLEGLDGGVAARPPLPERISLMAYRVLELTGPIDGETALAKAEPALLVGLAASTALDPKVQIAAADAALRLNAMTPAAVAKVYRRLPANASGAPEPVLRRARLFRAVEETEAPEERARLIRSLLDEARRDGVYLQTARMLAPLFSNLWPAPETRPLAEALAEVALAGGELAAARRWAESAASLQHWLALIDVANPQARQVQQSGLVYLADLARRGRLAPAELHRVVTVLDALNVRVPPRLWEAAGRVAQPKGGHLPPTGVLGKLAQASERKEAGRTIILVLQTLGPDGPDGANILALGDAIRALKRAGLEADARRVALEALFSVWPRTSGS